MPVNPLVASLVTTRKGRAISALGLAIPGIVVILIASVMIGGVVSLAAQAACATPTAQGAQQASTGSVAWTPTALSEIPQDARTAYEKASRDVNIDPFILAGIGKHESGHGTNPKAKVVNSSGCIGPMQLGIGGKCGDFVGEFGLDGNGDGTIDPVQMDDAVYTAANGLRKGKGAPAIGGSPEAYRLAVRKYNGSGPKAETYADKVMATAVTYGYRTASGTGATSTEVVSATTLQDLVDRGGVRYATIVPVQRSSNPDENADPPSGQSTTPAAPSSGAVSAEALDAWMKKEVPGSPLIGLGHVFIKEGTEKNVDPRLLVAIARMESVLGTAGSGKDINNAFGLGPAIKYPSWEAGIAAAARTIHNYGVRSKAYRLDQIQAIWAPVGASNDPNNLNSNWVTGVGKFYRDLGGDPTGNVNPWNGQATTGTSTPTCNAAAGSSTNANRARIVEILQAELALGLKETGVNCGPPLDKYFNGKCGKDWPWCAAFASWVWAQAGVPMPFYSWVPNIATWAEKNTVLRPRGTTPLPGDAVIWNRDGSGGSHVDIVEQVLPGGKIIVIGGNVSDTVTRKSTIDINDPAIRGFASPYKDDGTDAPATQAAGLTLQGEYGAVYGKVGGPATSVGTLTSGSAWSTMKVPVAIAAARSRGANSDTRAAITASDNEAARRLWNSMGSGAAQRVNSVLQEGGASVQVNTTVTRSGFTAFGQTDWSLSSQQAFAQRMSGLSGATPVVQYMGQITSSHRWGLGSIGSKQWFKGGWGPDEGGRYLVRQFGIVELPSGTYAIAIAVKPSDGQFATGTSQLTTLAKWVEANAR